MSIKRQRRQRPAHRGTAIARRPAWQGLKSRWLTALALSLAACLSAVHARADVLDDLARRTGFVGHFEQQVFDQNNALLATSAGEFAVLRPNAFRWEVKTPDRQLLLISDGVLWQYDRDLETVIRRRAPDGETSPLQLLTADREALEARYHIEPVANGLALIPKEDNDLFERLVIAAPAAQQLSLTFTDTLAQKIVIQLALEPDANPSPTLFNFEPPAGVEWLEGRPGAMDFEGRPDAMDAAQ